MAREEDLTDQQFDELCQHYAPTYLHRASERAAPAVLARTILTITYENGFPEFSDGSHHNDVAAEETGLDSDLLQPMAGGEDLTDQQFDELCQHYAPTILHRASERAVPAVQARTILTITYENGFPEFSDDSHHDDVAKEETGPDSDLQPMAGGEDLTDQQFDELCQHYKPTYLHRPSERPAPAVQARTILTFTYENGFPVFSDDSHHHDVAADDAEEETDSDSGTDTADAETDEDDSDDETTQAEETDAGSDAPTVETDTDTDTD